MLYDLDSVTLYAACLEGSDPIRLFEKRINARRGKVYEFHCNIHVFLIFVLLPAAIKSYEFHCNFMLVLSNTIS